LLLSLVETGSQTAQLAAKKKQANDAQRSPPMREAERESRSATRLILRRAKLECAVSTGKDCPFPRGMVDTLSVLRTSLPLEFLVDRSIERREQQQRRLAHRPTMAMTAKQAAGTRTRSRHTKNVPVGAPSDDFAFPVASSFQKKDTEHTRAYYAVLAQTMRAVTPMADYLTTTVHKN